MGGSVQQPPLYVALINYNGWRNVIECLETLMRSDYRNLRVLVLDNGSTDGSIDRIRAWAAGTLAAPLPQGQLAALVPNPVPKPIATALASKTAVETSEAAITWPVTPLLVVDCGSNLGFAGANNVALRFVLRAEEDARVLLLNDDTVVAPTALSAMAAVVSDSTAVGATLLQYHAPERIETLGGATVTMWNAMSRLIGWNAPRSGERPAVIMDFISGCCLMMTRNVLERVGLLDERFFIYSEDTDWGVRARKAGITLTYAPSAEVWHKGSSTAGPRSAFQDYHMTKSAIHFVRKYGGALVFPVSMTFIMTRFSLPKIARRQWGRLKAVSRGFVDFWAESRAARDKTVAPGS